MTIMFSKARELFEKDYQNSQELTASNTTTQNTNAAKKGKMGARAKKKKRK
ncbi:MULTISPECIES: hypothetical protein [Pontibacillus]|uniref:Uncharacterized protein n=1 Tax=Pontibacillus chungwhensis TaxID=265426 RepID=A0ABY8V1P0_9BACI|nr:MULTISPECIES: hypothetical protein [Pontibacillus]MCD5322377.1 hypothetical protein [Pontibacillus sp. HN14]WIF99664.1 hypothetical protein QNI29_08410 [Pontibacillus chungwhensis]